MVYDYFDKYTFMCEMYEEVSDTFFELVLHYFPFDNSCQVMNLDKGKQLLRRTQVPYLKPAMLQVGNVVNIFSKLLLIKDCAPATMRTLFNHVESTFALIKPVPPSMHGKIITFIIKKGFRIVSMKNGSIDKDFAKDIYKSLSGSSMLPIIIDYLTSGEVIGLELVAPNAIEEWAKVLGATNPAEAAPGTLRNIFGENKLRNIAHAVKTKEEAGDRLDAFFGHDEKGKIRIPFKATFKNCTCCVIKPHAVTDGNLGNIIEHISTSDKFYVSAMAMFSLKLHDANEFYEIYYGILPLYEAMCIHLAEGKCVILEVKCKDPSLEVVSEFRKLCGPRDPALCRQLYPDTIRALYGKTKVRNAVHCTDLPEDGESEVEYFFKLIARSYT
ncbi:hypothetical protein PYW08_000209 [Mythimna loreyi]|uniref:Uncharacterized protein n=1 Tax=Mythimna loreyi TaxID=667449 RepID=A0ACC2RBN1_9NEOP|nr:hypothetical protein PYW08_000209 [Mythimna loreyi]